MPPSACTGREETDAVRAQAPLQVHSSQAPPYATHGVGDLNETSTRPLVGYGYTYISQEDDGVALTAERSTDPRPGPAATRVLQQLEVAHPHPPVTPVALTPVLGVLALLRVNPQPDIMQRSS